MSFSSSLRFRILAAFLTAVSVTSLAALSVTYVGGHRIFEAWVVRSNRFLARAVARHLEQGLTRGARSVEALARRLQEQKDPKERLRLLDDFLEFGELFSNAYLFDSRGRVELSRYRGGASGIAPPAGHAGESYHDYPAPFPAVADRAAATGRAAWSPVFYSGSGRPQISRLQPLPGTTGGKPELLSVAIYAVSEQIDAWIQGLQPGTHGYVAVLDSARRVLAATGALPRSLVAGAVAAASGGPEAVEVAEMDGREDLLIREPLPAVPLTVLVGLPRDVAYRPLAELRTPALAALALALVLGFAGALAVSRRILVPLEALIGGIRRVGDGVLSHRVTVGSADELGQAASAFNRMAERLHRDQLVDEVWRDLERGR